MTLDERSLVYIRNRRGPSTSHVERQKEHDRRRRMFYRLASPSVIFQQGSSVSKPVSCS